MKISLIYPYFLNPRIHDEELSVPPLGIYYVGAMLKENGYDVNIFNWHNMQTSQDSITAILTKERPDIIGFSILHANRWGGIDIARIAKKLNPDVKIVFGGIGATFLGEHLLSNFADIDYIVMGEGETTFLDLVRLIENSELNAMPTLSGLVYRQHGRIHKTDTPKHILDLDQLPNPAKYFNYQHVAFTRGCPGNCSFCSSPLFWGQKVRNHSPAYFVDQLELLVRQGTRFFYFSDDTFTFKKEYVIEICKQIIERHLDITWVAIARINHIQADTLYWMRKAGCIQISFGLESGSQTIRQTLNKPLSTKQIKNVFQMVKQYGIMPRAYFIYGSPGETPDTIRASIDLIKAIQPLSIITYILDIFPGTKIYTELVKQGRINEKIWLERIEDMLYFELDANLSQEDILAYGKAIRQSFHQLLPDFIDGIELIDDPEFNQLHADFYSRLGMTFSHGDYSKIDEIPNKQSIAESLFLKSLAFHPNHRAYLGLGSLYQRQGFLEKSIHIIEQGLNHFKYSMDLSLCQGINLMNQGKFETALGYLLDFKDQEHVRPYVNECYQALKAP